ncbi:MAG: pacearchaeosortase [Nanoarchaeota archaeon]|nr:pacearchaeosortase [Nanoarchaeota archaeon]MBU1501837.1 pacearchaeosortase [Nanoarchaeota archaeon]MBU2459366.1 pacearchaeosortase [Nanoarchaeota archaeon]
MVNKKRATRKNPNLSNLILRYLILVAVAFPGLWLFYKIFTPLTAYPVHFILGLFYNSIMLTSTTFLVNDVPIELINACIAGSAYYLLLIFNLSTPGIKIKTRVNAILFSFAAFLILNIIRIVALSSLAISGSSYFDVTHSFFWYGLSTFIVVGIWFAEVKMFKIKEIPLYSDLKSVYKVSHLKK